MLNDNKVKTTTELFGTLLLVGGLAAGIILVKQPQLLAQKAATVSYNCTVDCTQLMVDGAPMYCDTSVGKCKPACAEDCSQYTSVHGYYYCDTATHSCKRTCSADPGGLQIAGVLGSYFCSPDGNVSKVVMKKDVDPLCPDFKWYETAQMCNPSVNGNTTINYECRTGVKYGQWYLGIKITSNNTNIYPGGVACIPVSKTFSK